MSTTQLEAAPSEPVSATTSVSGVGGGAGTFPPYPPYAVTPAPPSVADTIIAGREMRVHKSMPKQQVRPPPKPAKPKGPKATDVKLNRRAARSHARCLRKYNAVLTDRLERMAKPPKRSIICLWRDYAHRLPADTIARLRSMLDADEPFKPEQAYEYFINMKKTKKKNNASKVNDIKRDVLAMCVDKRFVWARNATVAFARGIQQRLARPGRYALADGMLRLSNIILDEICGIMHTRTPSRRCTHPKAKFMMEMSDKVAVWIDEILSESEDRMLMMDFDEDEDILQADAAGPGFADDFLDMMGGGGGLLGGPKLAYTKFTGEMLEVFLLLTAAMNKRGDQELFKHGKCSKTCKEGADELKQAEDFTATEFDCMLAKKLNSDLTETVKPDTPKNLEPFMKEMVDICANYLAQYAEYNKDKGPAFRLLVQQMKTKPNQQLYSREKAKRIFGTAAKELIEAKGLESDHDDPNLSQEIHAALKKTVESSTPPDLKDDMKETLDICSKYLSEIAVDENERGPAFDLLISTLQKCGSDPFTPEFPPLEKNFMAAYTLKSAPGLSSVVPDPKTETRFNQQLHRVVDPYTDDKLKPDMTAVIDRCGKYLSAFVRDREKAVKALVAMMKANPKKEVAQRDNYTMTYGAGATEIETAPTLVPFLPVKDIADEGKRKLGEDMEGQTPPELRFAMKAAVQDAAKHLSQSTALRSGVAGARYPLSFLSAVCEGFGNLPLFKFKSYGQTYKDGAETLKYAGPLETSVPSEELQYSIHSEMKRGVPSQLTPTVANDLDDIVGEAATHLAAVNYGKAKALDHLIGLMKGSGDAELGILQGYKQTYADGARRIENSDTLTNDKVDKGAYDMVRPKLNDLNEKNPSKEFEKYMPGIIDDTSKFLSSPNPTTEAEKRQVLGDILARKGKEIIGQHGLYKMTYEEAGKEIMKAPVGMATAHDPGKKQETLKKVNEAIPDENMKTLLKVPADEGSAYISDLVSGRGEALQLIHDDMKKNPTDEFLNVGKFQKNIGEASDILKDAPHFVAPKPSGIIMDKVTQKINTVPAKGGSDRAQNHMAETKDIASNYLAGVATESCGLNLKDLMALDGGADSLKGKESSVIEVGTGVSEASGTEESEAARKRREELERRKAAAGYSRGAMEDSEHEAALSLLHKQLRSKGTEMYYKQPHTEVTHSQASDWLSMKPPMKVDKTVKESGDTARLHKKFERKLSALVAKQTPSTMKDVMQDVVIESARILSENFVSKNYKALVRDGLIAEMQKRGNEILVDVGGATETFFFAAQRLKKTNNLDVQEPCDQVAYILNKKLDDMVRCRSMARKLTATMKDHVKDASNYLSEHVTKPDAQIEAYVALLGEMETTSDALLIEGDIPKSYKDAAAYLRQLTSNEDQIGRANSSLQSSIETKLKSIMANVPLRGYTKSVLDSVIADSTRLLVSYIMLQGEKTEALKVLIDKLQEAGDGVLLRHGNVRKSYADGADVLRGKSTDQLHVDCVDPVVARKLQIKLNNLMQACTPDKYSALMDDVIEDATMYLAVYLLQPKVIQVCKCMKNVLVQCELWCDEILRRVARPRCPCPRHVTAVTSHKLHTEPDQLRATAPGLEVSLSSCPATRRDSPMSCPAAQPTPSCSMRTTTAYMVHAVYDRNVGRSEEKNEEQDSLSSPSPRGIAHQSLSERGCSPRRLASPPRTEYSTRTPIISTEQMSDWHAMMVSLMWNVQAWRDWIQESIDKALAYQPNATKSHADADDAWLCFQRRMATEALQWRQYNIFSRQLTMRLALRYRDKKIVSPTRATDKTQTYMECQQEMLEIIDMFNKWTHWITAVIKEANSLTPSDLTVPMHQIRWSHFKKKMQEYSDDWLKYNVHLKVCWEQKYSSLISEWLPAWQRPGPVWVVSACGAVPSGAVPAGLYADELVWVARTTYKCNVLPGALHPTKHCCVVYADGAVHHYTKYQVMCNADASWVAWRAGGVGARAVRAAPRIHIGRVLYRGSHLLGPVHAPDYRCHVVIFGRPFAFNCYELLVLNGED